MSDEVRTRVSVDPDELAESELERLAGGTPATTTTAGSGGGSGKATIHDITITKIVDTASPKLF